MTEKLVKYLEDCDRAYYETSNPLVSDDTYDALVESLRKLDPFNPYLYKVGLKSTSNKIGRLIPMGTLDKYHTEEDVSKWIDTKVSQGVSKFIVCPKYDGFAVELVYQFGNLMYAGTRGDGYTGEDVTNAVKHIKSIPQSLETTDFFVIVRGEVIIPLKHHDDIKALGYNAMRNAVPGIVRSCREDALKFVDFVAYEFIDSSNSREEQRTNAIYRSRFILEDYHRVIYCQKEILPFLQKIREKYRKDCSYEIDGVVIKSDKILDSGEKLLHPDYSIAWKYKSNREVTTLKDVEFQMGVTGYFTPVGIFEEVEFQGAKLSRASLGNITRIRSEFHGMNKGSLIEVSRRGDIIPYIESLVIPAEGVAEIEIPTHCPYCGHRLVGEEPHCINKSCPERLRLQITHYVSSVGIKGIGDRLVSKMISAGLITELSDIYTLDANEIENLGGYGLSAVSKWKSLQEKRLSNLEFLCAYPFMNLNEKVWKKILERYTFESLYDLSLENLLEIPGIGESKARDILSQINDDLKEIQSLHQYTV